MVGILQKKVTDNQWILEESTLTQMKEQKLVENNLQSFPYFGGDIERWFTNIKIEHARRVFGKDFSLQKKITWEDMQKGFERFNDKKKKDPLVNLSMYI